VVYDAHGDKRGLTILCICSVVRGGLFDPLSVDFDPPISPDGDPPMSPDLPACTSRGERRAPSMFTKLSTSRIPPAYPNDRYMRSRP